MIFGVKMHKNLVIARKKSSLLFIMTSFTVAFSGHTSTLYADFFPEIILDSYSKYCCGLLDFTSYNSIPNISDKKQNNTFHLKKKIESSNNGAVETTSEVDETITFPTGAYEIKDIVKYLKEQLASHNVNLEYEISVATSRVQIIFDVDIEWISGSVLNIIGFQQQQEQQLPHIFKAKTSYWSTDIVKITDIDIIRIECDIVSGSYINGKECHTIHQFSHCKTAPGFKFIEIPQHIIYLPMEKKQLRNIQIRVVDQNNNLIDFRGEQISCRIHIKKI